MKFYNYLNGIFYALYGLFGTLIPISMAKLMGWTPSLLGLHQIRATSFVMAALGIILCLITSQNRDQKLITMVLIFVTLSFAAGRCLGLIIDGAGPIQTYYEIGFEIFWSTLGALLIYRSK